MVIWNYSNAAEEEYWLAKRKTKQNTLKGDCLAQKEPNSPRKLSQVSPTMTQHVSLHAVPHEARNCDCNPTLQRELQQAAWLDDLNGLCWKENHLKRFSFPFPLYSTTRINCEGANKYRERDKARKKCLLSRGPFLESPENFSDPKLRPTYSVKLVFLHVVKEIKVKTTATFRASRRLPFEDPKRIKSPEKFPDFLTE